MRKKVKILFGYWVEIIVGLLILFWPDDPLNGIRYFLIYFFIIFLVISVSLIDYLRKFIRAFYFINELKTIAIMRKLKITEEELSIVEEGERMKMGEEEWREIMEELDELI